METVEVGLLLSYISDCPVSRHVQHISFNANCSRVQAGGVYGLVRPSVSLLYDSGMCLSNSLVLHSLRTKKMLHEFEIDLCDSLSLTISLTQSESHTQSLSHNLRV